MVVSGGLGFFERGGGGEGGTCFPAMTPGALPQGMLAQLFRGERRGEVRVWRISVVVVVRKRRKSRR